MCEELRNFDFANVGREEIEEYVNCARTFIYRATQYFMGKPQKLNKAKDTLPASKSTCESTVQSSCESVISDSEILPPRVDTVTEDCVDNMVECHENLLNADLLYSYIVCNKKSKTLSTFRS